MHRLKGILNSAWFSLAFYFSPFSFLHEPTSYGAQTSTLSTKLCKWKNKQNNNNRKSPPWSQNSTCCIHLTNPQTIFFHHYNRHLKTKDTCRNAATPSLGTAWKTLVDVPEKNPNFTYCHVSCCSTHGCFYLERKYRKALLTSNRGRIIVPQKSKVSQHEC